MYFTRAELIDYVCELKTKYPIISVEDPLGENDFEGFTELTPRAGIQIVGDDLFVTNPARLKKGISVKAQTPY